MAALLVAIAVMGILMSVAMPTWRQVMQREREVELIFRGEQYARAVGLFQRKYAAASPPSVELLVEQKFLRKRYKDPMVPDGEFQVICANSPQAGQGTGGTSPTPGTPASRPAPLQAAPAGTTCLGGIGGVTSKSSATALRNYNGATTYDQFQFRYVAVGAQAGGGAGERGGATGPPGGAGQTTPGSGGGRTGGGATPGEVVPE